MLQGLEVDMGDITKQCEGMEPKVKARDAKNQGRDYFVFSKDKSNSQFIKTWDITRMLRDISFANIFLQNTTHQKLTEDYIE